MTAFRLSEVNGFYYKGSGTTHFYRYSPFGNLSLCCPITQGEITSETIDLKDIKLYPLKLINTLRGFLLYSKYNRRVIRNAVKQADAVIAYVPSRDADYAQKLAKKQGKPCLLIAIGCPWDAYWNHSWKGKLMAPLAYWGMRHTLKFADRTIYVTQQFLQQRYPTNGVSIGISNVILKEFDDYSIKDRLKKIKKMSIDSSSEIKMATCAAIDVKYKSQADVIKAISRLKHQYNIHYYLAGQGKQEYLSRIASAYGVLDRVHFLGILDANGVKKLLKTIDIYIQPSKQEGLPRSIIEALALGVPCLGANTGGIPELLPEFCIFGKGNINEIVDKIVLILNKRRLTELTNANFLKAKEFEFDRLEKLRNQFIKDSLVLDDKK